MFSSLSLKNQTANEVDFFADEPKKQSPPPPTSFTPTQTPSLNGFSFEANFPPSGQVFSTGFAFDQVQTNPKQFSTSVGNKPTNFDFLPPAK